MSLLVLEIIFLNNYCHQQLKKIRSLCQYFNNMLHLNTYFYRLLSKHYRVDIIDSHIVKIKNFGKPHKLKEFFQQKFISYFPLEYPKHYYTIINLQKTNMPWRWISMYFKLSSAEILKYKNKIYWIYIDGYELSDDNLIYLENCIEWEHYTLRNFVSDNVLINTFQFQTYNSLSNIICRRKLPKDIIIQIINKHKKCIKFLIKYQDVVNDDEMWNLIFKYLSDDKYHPENKYLYEEKWRLISVYQKLDEIFIVKYQDKLDWPYIFKHQKLSNDFFERIHIETHF